MKSPYEIIIQPRITERALRLAEQGKYTFVVARDATKPDIARAIEEHYRRGKEKIKVVAVNTAHVRGRVKGRSRFRNPGHTPRWKKAVITLAPGQRLPDFGV